MFQPLWALKPPPVHGGKIRMWKVYLNSMLKEMDKCIVLFLTFFWYPTTYMYENLLTWRQSCRVGDFGDFFAKKILTNDFFYWNQIFLVLNQILLIFFKMRYIYTKNLTNLNRKENLMIIFLIWSPNFQLCSLILIVVDFLSWILSSILLKNC